MATALTKETAAICKGLIARGEKQHDIAAFFGVNGGRVAEVAKGYKFADVVAAPKRDLPTPAVVSLGYAAHVVLQTLGIIEIAVQSARTRILDGHSFDPRSKPQ
jgi:hypothetical protein